MQRIKSSVVPNRKTISGLFLGLVFVATAILTPAPANALPCPLPASQNPICADAGGPYSITVGEELILDGSGSASPFPGFY